MIEAAVGIRALVLPCLWAAAAGLRRRPLAGAALLTLLIVLALLLVGFGLVLFAMRYARYLQRTSAKRRRTEMPDIWFLNPPERPGRSPGSEGPPP